MNLYIYCQLERKQNDLRERGKLHSKKVISSYFLLASTTECSKSSKRKINDMQWLTESKGELKVHYVVMGRIMFEVQSLESKNRVLEFDYQKMNTFKSVQSSMFDRSKPKLGCSSSITKRWTCSSLFDVQVCSMNDLVNS